MTKIAHLDGTRVVVGIDTHKDEHVAVAVDRLGTRLGEHRLRVNSTGYAGLERWAIGMGDVAAFGVEGTGSFGAGLARFLSGRGPDTSGSSRSAGPTDPLAADLGKAILSMPKQLADVAQGSPKSGTHSVEMIRVLKVAKDSALKARTQAMNQMKALVVTAPAELRQAFYGLSVGGLVHRCAGFRPSDVVTPAAAAKFALRSIARRHQQLIAELKAIDAELSRLTPMPSGPRPCPRRSAWGPTRRPSCSSPPGTTPSV